MSVLLLINPNLISERDDLIRGLDKYVPNNDNWCKEADNFIKQLDVKIAQFRKDVLGKDLGRKFLAKAVLPAFEQKRSALQLDFVKKDCAFKLENIKAQETAKIIGEEVQKYEDDVLSGSSKESKNLFLIGGALLIVATGVILYFTKKK